MSFVIKQGNLLPTLRVTLLDENGDPVDLTSADSVMFRMRRVGDDEDTLFNEASIIPPSTSGIVQYAWDSDDTDVAGKYEAEFIVTMDGRDQSYPGDHDIEIEIFADDTTDVSNLVFCTPTQARSMTGKDLDLDDLFTAQFVISLYTGVQPETDLIEPTYYDSLYDQDKTGLRQATALMAMWLKGQPDYFERINVKQESADGESRHYNGNSLMLPTSVEWALSNTQFSKSGMYSIDTPRELPYLYTSYVLVHPLEELGWRRW